MCACDLFFRDNIQYTYERDDSQNHSWIDHILCTRSSSHLVSNAHTLQSGSNLSDHLPLLFNFTVNCAAASSYLNTPLHLVFHLVFYGQMCQILTSSRIATTCAAILLNFLRIHYHVRILLAHNITGCWMHMLKNLCLL